MYWIYILRPWLFLFIRIRYFEQGLIVCRTLDGLCRLSGPMEIAFFIFHWDKPGDLILHLTSGDQG